MALAFTFVFRYLVFSMSIFGFCFFDYANLFFLHYSTTTRIFNELVLNAIALLTNSISFSFGFCYWWDECVLV